MSIYGTVQALDQDKWVELFVLDATIRDAGLFYFHSGQNELKQNIVWQGNEYIALPVEASGFSYDSGQFPRPKLKLANIQGLFSTLVRAYNDLIGMKVIRKKTAVRYLDAVNFSGGNPSANPNEHLQDEVYYVTQKTAENKIYIEFELGSSLDLSGVYLPNRMVLANHCPFRYRGEECGYTGTNYYDIDGNPVATLAQDRCPKTLDGCKRRFGEYGDLSFGGYPGSSIVAI